MFLEKSQFPLTLYLIHLFVNWTWTPVFFGLHKLGLVSIESVLKALILRSKAVVDVPI